MTTMNVSLPDSLKTFVDEQVAQRGYGSSSEYVRDLIRRDQERTDKIAAMQRLIDEAEESGVSPLSMAEVRAEARRQAGVSGV